MGKMRYNKQTEHRHSAGFLEDGSGFFANGFDTGEKEIEATRRIVAAWNACDGLETELLETLPLNFKAHALQCAELRAQNAALLEAVKEMERMLPVLTEIESEFCSTWLCAIQGTGIATLNGYRDTLEKALEAVKNENQ